MARHEWRDRKEDGEIIFHRANQHAGKWRFQSKSKKAERWTYFEPEEFPLSDLKDFRDIIWTKHERRRVHQGHFDQIENLIKSREAAEVAAAADASGEEE